MAEETNIINENNNPEEQNIMEEQNNLEKQKNPEELTQDQNNSPDEPDPPDQSSMINQDNSQAEGGGPEPNWPLQERCEHVDLNEIGLPFRIAQPYELRPLTKYFFRIWSEDAHFMPAVELLPPFGNSFPKGG